MDFEKRIPELVEQKKDTFTSVSDEIWGFAEPRFQEIKSSGLLSKTLESEGFRIEFGCGADTAFIAEWGSGKPVIGFLGEFDALSGLSQQADIAERIPVEEGGQGHGCGHNLLGAASASAAVAIKDCMDEAGLTGTIRYYGCPAEENGGGKTFMVRDGAFKDCDIAITWHPTANTSLMVDSMLANFRVFYNFRGISSHAAAAPHLGRSALDAVELMNVGVNYMREHMISEARVHYAVTDSGGTAPNVVQPKAQVLYAIRAPRVTDVRDLKRRIDNIARGAALMTETEVEIRQVAGYSEYIGNCVIEAEMDKYMKLLHPTLTYTEEELSYLQKFKDATPDTNINSYKIQLQRDLGLKGTKLEAKMNKPIADVLFERYGTPRLPVGGSSDVGDVSWVVPTAQCSVVTFSMGAPPHSWLWVAQGKSLVAHKGLLHAAKIMALTGLSFIKDPTLVEKAKAQHLEDLGGEVYEPPIPAELKPGSW